MTQFIIRYRWVIIVFCCLTGIAFASLIPSAKTDPEIRNYVPANMESRVATDRIEKEFGVQDMILILFSDTNIVTTGDLRTIKNIDDGLSRINAVSTLISPFTIRTIKGESGMMVADHLITRIPSGERDIRSLREKIVENQLTSDVVFSKDLTTASITATLSSNMPETETLQKIDSVIAANDKGKPAVLKGGLPYIRKSIMTDVAKDAIIVVPAALFIMLLILKLSLKDWRDVFMPFSVVVISTGISMGLIPLLGWKISILALI